MNTERNEIKHTLMEAGTKCARYALRMESADGTLEEPYHYMNRKADALRAAKRAAKESACSDIARLWVDDTATGLGVASFATAHISKGAKA